MFILDTSVLVDIERGNPQVVDYIKSLRQDCTEPPCITFATLSEYLIGILKTRKHFDISEIESIYPILHSTTPICKLFAELKISLQKRGITIGDFDILIAATAMANGKTLVTLDKDFKKIENLKVICL